MIGIQIKDGFLDFGRVDFKCPHCQKEYNDIHERYQDKCNRNKKGYTKIKCGCDKIFYMTYNFMGDAVSFI